MLKARRGLTSTTRREDVASGYAPFRPAVLIPGAPIRRCVTTREPARGAVAASSPVRHRGVIGGRRPPANGPPGRHRRRPDRSSVFLCRRTATGRAARGNGQSLTWRSLPPGPTPPRPRSRATPSSLISSRSGSLARPSTRPEAGAEQFARGCGGQPGAEIRFGLSGTFTCDRRARQYSMSSASSSAGRPVHPGPLHPQPSPLRPGPGGHAEAATSSTLGWQRQRILRSPAGRCSRLPR